LQFPFLLFFEIYGRQHPVSAMLSLGVVEKFDVIKNIGPRLFAG